jgi:endothelin-converting enzyme
MRTTILRVTRCVNLDQLYTFRDTDLLPKIVFPAGILQPPFFSLEWSVVFAVAMIFPHHASGQDICHMVHLAWLPHTNSRLVVPLRTHLTRKLMKNGQHAFDSTGRLYNQQGKLEEWWTRQTSDAYQIRQDCIVEQYSGIYF